MHKFKKEFSVAYPQGTPEGDWAAFTLSDLATATGVEPRTIRSYIERGLLPGALSRGRGATYSQEHLAALRLIQAVRRARPTITLGELRILLQQLTPAQIQGIADGAVVEFAVMIGIKLTNTTVGYEYTVRPLVQLRQSDAIVKLRAEAAKALSPEIRKALEAGTPAPKQLTEGEKKEHKRK